MHTPPDLRKRHLLIFLFVPLILFLFSANSYSEISVDVSGSVTVNRANERSVLDRRTNLITSTADITITNSSAKVILLPLHGVVSITNANGPVLMPEALGGPGTQPYDKYYYDLSSKVATSGLFPGASVTFGIKFVRSSSVRFGYDILTYGILPSNFPPVLLIPSPVSIDEGTVLDVYISATDPEGDLVTLSASPLPSFARFTDNGNGTGTLSLSPDFSSAGPYNLSLTATDSKGASATKGILITVNNVNRPPSLTLIGNQSVAEGNLLSFQVNGSDPDGDPLQFLSSNLPSGALFVSASRTFTWTPGFDVSNRTGDSFFDVFFEVRDGKGGTASETIRITVQDVNRPPALNPVPPQSISEGSPLNFLLTGSDPDGDSLIYSAEGLPAGAVFDPVAHSFSWTPDYTQAKADPYSVRFLAGDGIASAEQVVQITVVNTNRSPVITTTGIPDGRVDQVYSALIIAQDEDNDPLTYTLTQGPAGMVINPVNGQLTWRPLISQIGDHTVEVRAEDGHGGAVSRQYALHVPDTIPPSVFLNGPKEAIPGATFTATVDASDNIGVASVTIEVDGQSPLELSAPPYQREITLPPVLSVGSSVTLRARARDANNNISEASLQVAIVGIPDTTPPAVTLNAPAQITAGEVVHLSASVSDTGGSGVSSVTFFANGEPVGTVSGLNPTIEYHVPADAPLGSTPVFTVQAHDFSGNSTTAEASPTVTDNKDSTPPDVTLTAPQTVEKGGTLPVHTQTSDATGVARVDVYIDHVLVATYTAPPTGDMNIPLPPNLTPGMDALVEVKVTDFAGNETTQSQYVSIEAVKPPARGVITGEVYNDTTGLPLEGAQVVFSKTDGSTITVVTDTRGRYSLAADEGGGRLIITHDGFSRAERTGIVVQGNTGIEIFDARLTPLTSLSQPVSAILGARLTANFSPITAGLLPALGSVNTQNSTSGQIIVTIPSGALNSDNVLFLNQISPQGLQGLLPYGWSPVGVLDITPHGISFNSPASLAMPNELGLSQAAGVILALWDEISGNWKAVADASLSSDGTSISGQFNGSGQYALLLPDALPQAPQHPSAGDILQGVSYQSVPQDVSTHISPQPKIIFYKPGVHSDVGLNINSASAALPSGTQIWSKITEEYNFYSGAKITTESFTQDIVLYNYNLAGAPGTTGYPVTPSYTFEPLTLEKGIITVDVMAPPEGPRNVALIGPDGGTITAVTGESITVPSGAVTDFIPVEVVSLSLTGSGITLPAGFNLAGAVSLSFGGRSLNLPASLSVPLPSSLTGSGQFLLVKPSDIQGATRLVLTGVGRVENGKVISFNDLSQISPPQGEGQGGGGVLFEGILSAGRYFLIQTDTAIGFAEGAVLGTDGPPLSGAIVSSDALSIISLSMSQGKFVSAVASGPFLLTALDPVKMDSGTASGIMPDSGAVVHTDISLVAEPPRVVSVTPVNGAENIPLASAVKIQFSEPLDPNTVNTGNIILNGPAGNVTGVLTLSANNTLVTFRPAVSLTSNTHYILTVSQGIKDLAGYTMVSPFASGFTSLDTIPPPPPAAGSVSAAIPGANGKTTVTAAQGTAGVHDTVWIINTTKGISTPVLVNADGGFSVSVDAGITDKLQVKLTDPAGNETLVPLPRFTQTNPDGSISAAVDAEGGRVEGPEGVVVDVPAGAFPDGAVITLKAVAETDFPVQFTEEQKAVFTYSGGIQIGLGGKTPGKYLNVGILPKEGDTEDDQWIVNQVVNVDNQTQLNAVDTARIIAGKIMTSSPPCPGVTGAGVYGFLKSNKPVGVTYGTLISPLMATISQNLVLPMVALATPDRAGEEIEALTELTHRVCMPALGGKATLVPNNVKIELYWDVLSHMPPPVLPNDIMEVVVVNNTRGSAETRFSWADREHLPVTEPDTFTVVGTGSDTYSVNLADVTGTVHPVACFLGGTGILCKVIPTSTPNIVQVKLDWANLTQAGIPPGDIQDIAVIDVTQSNNTSHFRRQGQTESFNVEGANGDSYSVKLIDNRGTATTYACPSSGSGGIPCKTIPSDFVAITVALGNLANDARKLVVKNWTTGKETAVLHRCPHPGVTCATPDRRLIIDGTQNDVYSLSIINIDSMGNQTVTESQVSPATYPVGASGNLLIRAAAGAIDPTAAQILEHNALHGPYHLLPVDSGGSPVHAVTKVYLIEKDALGAQIQKVEVPLASILEGGFSYLINGQVSNYFSLTVEYNDGTFDGIDLPRFHINVVNAITGQTVNTIVGYVPPRDKPLKLGFVSSSVGGPLTLSTPPLLTDVDPSATFALSFSNPVSRNSVQSGYIVKNSNGNIIQGTFQFSEGDTVVLFTPATPLRMGEIYHVSLSGVTDLFGNSLPLTTINVDTFKPRKIGFLDYVGSRSLEPISDIDILRTITAGVVKTGIVAVTESRDSWKLLNIDVTDPASPVESGHSGGGSYKKRVTLIPHANFTLRPRASEWFTTPSPPCGPQAGATQFSGYLAVSTSFNVRMSYFSFFDVTNPANPCLIGGKILTVDPMYLDSYTQPGTLHVTGFARGVAVLQHSAGYAAYAAVGEIGIMAADIGKNIPESDPCVVADPDNPPDYCKYPRTKEGLYSGDYADVAVVGAPKPAPTLVSISVTPVSATLQPGETQQYRATGKYSDGSEAILTSVATWMSSDTGVATIDATGKATSIVAGQSWITAAKDGITSNAAVLKVRELVSITITPATASRMSGESIQYDTQGTYSDGTTESIPARSLAWTSSNTGVATIDSGGLATAIAAGHTDITASKDAVTSNTAVLDVITLVSISVTPLNATISVGATQQYAAIGTYSNSTTADITNLVVWHCTCMPVSAQVNSLGLATGLLPGTEVIWAELAGVISNTVTLTVTAPLYPWVVINEVVAEPQQDWNDSIGGDGVPFNDMPGSGIPDSSDQWIELFNWGGFVNLSGWTIRFFDVTGSMVTVPLGSTTLGSWQYIVIGNPGNMSPDTKITLSDATGFIMDEIDLNAIRTIIGGATGVGDESIARVPNGIDSGNPVDFRRRAATIGGPNPSQ